MQAVESVGLVVREAAADDVPAIIELNAQAGQPAGTAASYRAAVEDPRRLLVVAASGSGLAGWAKTHWWDTSSGPAPAGHYLGGIAVAGNFRRQGIGTRLTRHRLEWIWDRAAEAWYVVNAANRASIEMHRAFGFIPVAQGPAFHTTRFEGGNGWLMWAERPIGFPNQ